MVEAGDIGLLAGFDFVAHIDLTRRVLPHQHHRKTRFGAQLGNGVRDPPAKGFGDSLAVEAVGLFDHSRGRPLRK